MTNRKPILLVEDDPDIADACRELLQEAGYRVWVASRGEEALAFLEREIEPCLVLLDLHMPGLQGEQLVREVERRTSNPIVIATALRSGIPERHKVLHKPYELDELLDVVRTYDCESVPEERASAL